MYRIIPNKLNAWIMVGSIGIGILEGRWNGFIFFGAFMLSFPLYLIHVIGAGDAKLYVALSGVFSWNRLMAFGIMSLGISVVYGLLYKLIRYKHGYTKVPMAPGMLGAALIIWWGGGF